MVTQVNTNSLAKSLVYQIWNSLLFLLLKVVDSTVYTDCIITLLGVAFSPNDHTVLIYKKSGNKWEKESVLEEVSCCILYMSVCSKVFNVCFYAILCKFIIF